MEDPPSPSSDGAAEGAAAGPGPEGPARDAAADEAAGRLHWRRVFEDLATSLGAVWAACGEDFNLIQEGNYQSVACSVASTAEDDCPLVYVSPGFAALTGYTLSAAIGRNCRFLQPSDKKRRKTFNSAETSRLRDFVQNKTSGPIMSILLNVTQSGEPFWNLLYMRHTFLQRRGASEPGGQYIVSVHTKLEFDEQVIEHLLPWDVESKALENLANLRGILTDMQSGFTPTEQPLSSFADNLAAKWLLQAGRCIESLWSGEKFVPRLGLGAVQEFKTRWKGVSRGALCYVMELHGLPGEVLIESDTKGPCLKGDTYEKPIICAVADPSRLDCPLVYISKGFEEMTGYSGSYALGRNCRFLQPPSEMNTIVNGDELTRLKDFCNSGHRPANTLSLLLNEKLTGERFWNLLHLAHVQVDGHKYILGVHTILDLPMPSMIQMRGGKHYLEAGTVEIFVGKLGSFLKLLRELVASRGEADFRETVRFIAARICTFLKFTSDDYEGDHYVPKLGLKEVAHFESEITWKRALATVESKLYQVWEVSASKSEDVALCLSDPLGQDCPLVYISREFEMLTGYSVSWTVGRNSRFLQPKEARVNELYNKEDVTSLREFCEKPQPPGTQNLWLLVNENKDGRPFLNLLILEHIVVARKPFIFGVLTSFVNRPELLGELLAMDAVAVHGLQRLRADLREEFPYVGTNPLQAIMGQCLEKWAAFCPKVMTPPRVNCAGLGMPLPLVGLELTHKTILTSIVPQALENGIRHFHFVLPRSVLDPKMADLEERLLCLKLAQFAKWLTYQFFHYLQRCLVFSLRAPPQMVTAFTAAQRALRSTGYRISSWWLDVSGAPSQASIKDAWRQMLDARRVGEVSALGIYGGGAQALELQNHPGGEGALCIYSAECYPGKKADHVHHREMTSFIQGGGMVVAYNPFGQQNALLQAPAVVEAAETAKVSPAAVLLKAVQLQGHAALISDWGQGSQNCVDMEDVINKAGMEVLASSAGPSTTEEQFMNSLTTISDRALPNVHRTLVRDLEKVEAWMVEQMEQDLLAGTGSQKDQRDGARALRRQSTGQIEDEQPRSARPAIRRQSTGALPSEPCTPRRDSFRRQTTGPVASPAPTTPLRRASTAAVPDAGAEPAAGSPRAAAPAREPGSPGGRRPSAPPMELHTRRPQPRQRRASAGEAPSPVLGASPCAGPAAAPEKRPLPLRHALTLIEAAPGADAPASSRPDSRPERPPSSEGGFSEESVGEPPPPAAAAAPPAAAAAPRRRSAPLKSWHGGARPEVAGAAPRQEAEAGWASERSPAHGGGTAAVSMVQLLREENVALRVRLQELQARTGGILPQLPPIRAARRQTLGTPVGSRTAGVPVRRTPC